MTSLSKQKGDFLIESLIGMVLMSIIGVGVVTVTSKVSGIQKDMNVQTIAINQLRSALVENGYNDIQLCSVTPTVTLPGGETVTLEVQGCSAGQRVLTAATISDPNNSVADVVVSGVPAPIVISASSSVFQGDIVVGGRWVP